jgi:catechol 2,3-dioxygenase-like lactoylglutathione lyase family enzyme
LSSIALCTLASLATGCSSSPDAPASDAAVAGDSGRGTRPADAGASNDAGMIALCSGCPSELRDPNDNQVRVHHIHLNVKNAEEAIAFYGKFFGTRRVRLNDKADALWADPLLFLLNEGDDFDFSEDLRFGFEHVGLGVKDPVAWFEQASMQGAVGDPRNGFSDQPVSYPLPPEGVPGLDPGVDTFSFVYVRGPNGERIEVWSGLARFRHAHFWTPDIDASVDWYVKLLGVAPLAPMADPKAAIVSNGLELDGVQLNFLTPSMPIDYIEPDGQPIDHIAFSVPDLAAMFEHAQTLGVEIVSEPAQTELGFRSFFVRAPQQALVELVEAGPVSVP